MNGRKLMVAVTAVVSVLMGSVTHGAVAQEGIQRYVRYSYQGSTDYGVVRGEVIQQLDEVGTVVLQG